MDNQTLNFCVSLLLIPIVGCFMFGSIRYRLTIYFLLVGLIPVGVFQGLEYWQQSKALEAKAFEHLTSVREIKKRAVITYFERVNRDILFLASSAYVGQAMQAFNQAFFGITPQETTPEQYTDLEKYYQDYFLQKLSTRQQQSVDINALIPTDSRTVLLQHQYVHANAHPRRPHSYQTTHEQYHHFFSEFLQRYAYYDLFLVNDSTGHIVYSVFKETDFGTSLLDGPHAHSNIGRLFRELRKEGAAAVTRLSDFENYLPSYLYPASFIATPIMDGPKRIGTLILQMPITEVENIMTGGRNWENEGFGKSGESYLVGTDFRMRNDSRFIIEDQQRFFAQIEAMQLLDPEDLEEMRFHATSILYQKVETAAAKDAMSGRSDTRLLKDYRGVDVLSAYTPVDIPGLGRWALLCEIDEKDAFAAADQMRQRSVRMMILTAVLVILIAFLIGRQIAQPIVGLSRSAEKLAAGNLKTQAKERPGNDEIAQLIRAFNQMATSLYTREKELQESNAELTAQSEEIRQQMEEIEAQRDHLMESNETINQQREEIMAINEDLQQYGHELAKRNENILSSIHYAQRIQQAMLPTPEQLQRQFAQEIFALYRPKDIVSGDFYWCAQLKEQRFLVVADCTGHGVPGALMSMIGVNLLSEIVISRAIHRPDQVLDALHEGISTLLHQDHNDNWDSIDLTLICREGQTLQVASAKGFIAYISDQDPEKLIQIPATRASVGGEARKTPSFELHTLTLPPDQTLTFYLSTDGYQDQFGGPKNKRFSSARLRKTLLDLHQRPMAEQPLELQQHIDDWMGEQGVRQTDDITLLGFRLKASPNDGEA